MKTIQVNQMCSQRTGNPVANQFKIYTKKGVYFQSYSTIIAFKPHDFKGKLKLDKNYWDYSRTTLKYLYDFISINHRHRSKKNILKLIQNKDIILTNLN